MGVINGGTLTNDNPFDGMPTRDTVFAVKTGDKLWGKIRCGGPCKDNYPRIDIHVQDRQHFLKLQKAAIESISTAEAHLGFLIFCTGSWRACSTQRNLFAQDPGRFANPNTTAHTRGLAIDVSQNLAEGRLEKIHDALLHRGWHQARPNDEPWHYSFGLKV